MIWSNLDPTYHFFEIVSNFSVCRTYPHMGGAFQRKIGGTKCHVNWWLSLENLANKNFSAKKPWNPIALRACGGKCSFLSQKTIKSDKIWWGRAQSWWGKPESCWGIHPTNCRYRKLCPWTRSWKLQISSAGECFHANDSQQSGYSTGAKDGYLS